MINKTIKKIATCLLVSAAVTTASAQQVWTPDNGDGTFTNPILWGDWADPDVIRVGGDFYMVSTSMHYVPGCPILTSTDLVNWQMAGYAVERYDEDPRYDMQGGQLYLWWFLGRIHPSPQRQILCRFLHALWLGNRKGPLLCLRGRPPQRSLEAHHLPGVSLRSGTVLR